MNIGDWVCSNLAREDRFYWGQIKDIGKNRIQIQFLFPYGLVWSNPNGYRVFEFSLEEKAKLI
jgi:hypothetical protein